MNKNKYHKLATLMSNHPNELNCGKRSRKKLLKKIAKQNKIKL